MRSRRGEYSPTPGKISLSDQLNAFVAARMHSTVSILPPSSLRPPSQPEERGVPTVGL